MPLLKCELHREGDGAVRVAASGELDVATVGVVERHVEEALAGGAKRLVLDLSDLSFMASAGLKLVLRLAEQSSSGGDFEFGVVRGPRQVQRVFELTRTDGRVPWVDG